MIEQTVIDYLSGQLDAPVWPEAPERPPERFVLVEKTGGGCSGGLCHAVLAVQSCADSLWDALRLHTAVRDAMLELDTLDSVCCAALNTDYRFTDPASRRRRYQAVFDVTYYEEGEKP